MKRLYTIIILVVVYSLALGVRVYWFSQKNGLHVDEGMTVTLSCYKEYYSFEFNREYTGKEVKEKSFAEKLGIKEAMKDIGSLWKDNRDPPHTNLYYTFLRLSLIGLKNTDIKYIIFRGGILNLLFFTLSFVFFFLTARMLFPGSRLLQFSVTLCAFLSTAAISNTLFLRPYQIQETMFIIFCYYFIKTFDFGNSILNNDKRRIILYIVLLSLITAVTLMTGYYAVIFIGLFGLYIVYSKCREKKYAEIKFYVLILILGVLFAAALYPRYFTGFTSYRATEVSQTMFANISGNIKYSMTTAGTLLFKHFFTFPVIILCVLCLAFMLLQMKMLKLKLKLPQEQELPVQKHAWFVFAASLIYFIVTLLIAPYKVLRYGMPVFPFFVILPAILISLITKIDLNSPVTKLRRIPAIAAVLLCICFLPGAFNQNKIENIFLNKSNEYVFSKDKNVPVYVYVHYYAQWNWANLWKYANLVPYLNDEQKYYFLQKYEDLHSTQYDEFYLVMENFYGLKELKYLEDEKFEILDEIQITGGEPETPETLGYYFLCRKLKKIP